MASIASTASSRRLLSTSIAFGLLTSILVTLLASSSAPTPLYETYQARWGFSPVTITVIFGVYAVAVLVSLLVVGSLSDHIGRRPVLIGTLCAQAVVMLLFAFAGGVDVLLVARVLQGLATGAALGAIGAGLVDLHPGRGAVANATGAMSGTASGALVSALLVQLLPAPTKLIYLLLLVLFLVQALGVWAIAETSPRAPGIQRALRPTLAVPPQVREALLIAAPSLIAVWALAGFYGSLGPLLAAHVAHSDSTILGGAALFALAASGALTVLLFHRAAPRRFALVGNGLVIIGVAIVLWSVSATSVTGFFAGTVIAGAGFGAGFQGGLRTIMSLAGPTERAGVISVAYIICYLAMGLPAILAGILVVHGTVTQTAQEFGITVIVLAAITTVGTILSARRTARQRCLTPSLAD